MQRDRFVSVVEYIIYSFLALWFLDAEFVEGWYFPNLLVYQE